MKDKRKAKETAKQIFLDGKQTSKEIAQLVGVSERTLSKWVTEEKWREDRANRNVTPRELEADVVQIISALIEERKGCDDPKRRVAIADEISKYNKLMETLRKETRIALHVYVNVLDELMGFSSTRFPKQTPSMIEVQRAFLDHKAPEYL
jgi:transposase